MNTANSFRLIKAYYFAGRQTITAILLRLVTFPLKTVINRNPKLIVVISRPGSSFSDNSKYFFIYATGLLRDGEKVVYLTIDKHTYKSILNAGGKAVLHPTLSSVYMLLRCGTAVTDFDWFKFGSYPLTIGARLIQLYHGAPLKHIELDLFRKRLATTPTWLHPLLRLQKKIIGRYPFYDYVVSTSDWFIENVFQHCFKARQFISTGYPRNDILFGWPSAGSLEFRLSRLNVDEDTLKKVHAAKNNGKKICLYVPTFRNHMTDPFQNEVQLPRLSKFAQKNNLIFVLKLHPFMQGKYRIGNYPNLFEYAPIRDVYPLMPYCDLLITDYSSIFFDFLLLGKPILFFPYDLQHYLNQDRAMYFDYSSMTPGPKCWNYTDVEEQIKDIFSEGYKDVFAETRKEICLLTHDHRDNLASKRILDILSFSSLRSKQLPKS